MANGTNVPGLNEAPQFSQQVPGANLPYRQDFGKEGAGIQNLGETLESTARAGAEVYDEIQRQHDISNASKSYVDASVSHAKQLQTFQLSSPDGFVRDPDTKEVVKNSDGSQRTISQEYWSWADSDYQARQDNMSPRAAAMFRQQMQGEIGQNTKILQNKQLELQRTSADQDVNQSMSTLARDNDRNPYPDGHAYYYETRPDGSLNMRGNTDKVNDQLRTIQLWTTRQGPANGKPGMYNPVEVQKMAADRMSTQADSWVRSSVTNIMENDTPRDHKGHVSTTAVQQVVNLRDVIEGKDPQSAAARAKGLPTVNSSLTAEQADRWRNHLNTMLDGAKKIDRSDYEFHLQEMNQSTKSGMYDTPAKLFNSPQFKYLVHAAEPLGLTAEAQLKNFSEIFSNAAGASYGSSSFDLSSEASKRQQIMQNMGAFARAWPQYGSSLGAKFTGDMANAVVADATKGALAKLTEETHQYQQDPAKYAAGIASGYQNPTEGIRYRSPVMKSVEDRLYADPSLFAPFKFMSNGSTVLTNAITTMKRIGAQGFGQGYEPNYLSKDSYQAWAGKIDKSSPEQVEEMFHQVRTYARHDAGTVMDQLVKFGGLDPRYQIAQNLPTASARIAAYSDIMSKGAAIDAYTKAEGGEAPGAIWKKATRANQDLIDFNNRLHGADSPEASRNVRMLNQTWASAYSSAMGVQGTSTSEAEKAANERVQSQIAPVTTVQGQHNWFGVHWGHTGPSSRVQFSRPDLSQGQQQTIQGNLLTAQQTQELSKYSFVPAPVAQGAYDFNKKVDAKWVAEHPFIWYPVRAGTPQAAYRLQYQGMNADGSPNGKGYDLRVLGSDGTPSYYEVKESDALKKSGP